MAVVVARRRVRRRTEIGADVVAANFFDVAAGECIRFALIARVKPGNTFHVPVPRCRDEGLRSDADEQTSIVYVVDPEIRLPFRRRRIS